MNDNYRRYKSLRRDPEVPIFVRNVTDEPIEIKFTYDGDIIAFWKNPIFDWKTMRLAPLQLVDLRTLISETPLTTNLHLLWYIETNRLVVENEHSYYRDDPEEEPEVIRLREEAQLATRLTNDRWRAILATRRKHEHRNSNNLAG